VAPRFSVVVPVKDSIQWLPELAHLLSSQQPPAGGYEVVWVDDQSTDGSFELLTELSEADSRMRVVRGPAAGPGAARNAGIHAAAGQYVAFTDSDTLPNRDWLAQAAKAIDSGALRALEGSISAESDERGPLIRNLSNHDGGRYMTANMIYEKAVLEKVGGFDETFRDAYLEDSDLAFRVLDEGVDIPFVPSAEITHRDIPVTPLYMLKEQRKRQWMALLARKHPRRYEENLRPKLQVFRPGDPDLLIAVPLAFASRRSGAAARLLSLLVLAVAARRVVRSADVERVPAGDRPAFAAAALIRPGLGLVYLIRGWVKFRKVAL
jgi:glycosyltransferase involved in cell wall biosynthesis